MGKEKEVNSGNGKKVEVLRASSALLTNSILTKRLEFMEKLGKSFFGKRDIYTSLGYTKIPEFSDFYARYRRQDMAKSVIDRPVKDSWMDPPSIEEIGGDEEVETEFEKTWKKIAEEKKVYYYMTRLDILCGVGGFAVMLLGVNDGKKLDQPLSKAAELMYLRIFKASDIAVDLWETNPQSPRYGHPVFYQLRLQNPGVNNFENRRVHYSRVIHTADGCIDNDIIGCSRLEDILNRLQDLELVVASGAESFWQGAFKGLAFLADKDTEIDNPEEVEEEIEKYIHKYQRYIQLQGMTIQELGGSVGNPSPLADFLVSLISGAKRIPKRILLGSERGDLASTQDADNWFQVIKERQTNFCEPTILRPFIDRLIEIGILPSPKGKYRVEWVDRTAPTEEAKAVVAKTKLDMLVGYVGSLGAEQVIPENVFKEKFLGFDKEEIEAMQGEIDKAIEEVEEAEEIEKKEEKKEAKTPDTQEVERK